LGIKKLLFNHQTDDFHPGISPELENVLEKFEKEVSLPTEFWDDCYSNEVLEEILNIKEKLDSAKTISKKLQDLGLITIEKNGRGINFC